VLDSSAVGVHEHRRFCSGGGRGHITGQGLSPLRRAGQARADSVCLGLVGPARPQAPAYAVVDLAVEAGESTTIWAISNAGQALGAVWFASGVEQSFVWDPVAGRHVFPADNPAFDARDINDLGQVAGIGATSRSVVGLMQCRAVQLFVDRAQATRPDFQLTAANAGSVAELCRRLEGIPLAIELAAAWAQVLSPGQMVAQLQDRFQFLVSRRRAASERHRTLRAALDWSYQLLSPQLQGLLAALSVFRGGWTVQAVEVVCQEPDALEAMLELRECSIVHCRERLGQMRYDMLETFREFAAELVDTEAEQALRARRALYFLGVAESRAQEADGPDEAPAFAELEGELGNLGAAVDSLVAAGEHQLAARLAAALSDFLWRRGYWEEHVRWVGAAAASLQASTPDDRALGARLWHGLARVAYDRGDLDDAGRDCERGTALVGDGRAGQWHAMLVNVLGLTASRRQRYEEAERLLKQCLALFRKSRHTRGEGMALHNLGVLAYTTGQPESARALYEEALPIRRASGDVRGVAETQNNLGVLAYESGELSQAEQAYRESLRSIVALADILWMAVSLCNIGEIALRDGRADEAIALLEPAEHALRHLGSVHASYAAECLEEALRASPEATRGDGSRWREALVAVAREACKD